VSPLMNVVDMCCFSPANTSCDVILNVKLNKLAQFVIFFAIMKIRNLRAVQFSG